MLDTYQTLARDLFLTWHIWVQLFQRVDSPKDRPAQGMKNLAPQVFGYIRWSMLSYIILELAKLADSDSTGGQDNLTINRVRDQLRHQSLNHDRLMHALNCAEEKIKKAGIPHLRHKILAHNDLPTSLGKPMPDVNIEDIGAAVKWVGKSSRWMEDIRAERGANLATSHWPDTTEIGTQVDRLLQCLAGGYQNP